MAHRLLRSTSSQKRRYRSNISILAASLALYFRDRGLRVLDGKARTHYSAVTIRYITEFVNSNANPINEVAEAMLYLHQKRRVKSLFCPDVKEVVFHNKPGYWNYDKSDVDFDSYSRSGRKTHKYFINHINQYKQNAK